MRFVMKKRLAKKGEILIGSGPKGGAKPKLLRIGVLF
jgi:hypothetical protein